jgi:hypothetical protein
MPPLKSARLFGWIARNFNPGYFTATGVANEIFGPPALNIGLPFFGPDGEVFAKLEMHEELMVIGTGATTTSAKTDMLPINSIILAVRGINVVAIPTAATYNVQDNTTASRFGSAYPVAVPAIGSPGWIFIAHNQPANTNVLGPVQLANSPIVIDPNANPATNVGRVLVQVFFWRFSAIVRQS